MAFQMCPQIFQLRFINFFGCVFSNVSSMWMLIWMHSHNGCTCLFFLRYVSVNVFAWRLDESMYMDNSYTYAAFLRCVVSDVLSNRVHEKRHSHIACICSTFLHYCVVFSNVTSMHLDQSRRSHIVWFFSTVHFQIIPQIVSRRRGTVTLVAFVWLFSTVRFQM